MPQNLYRSRNNKIFAGVCGGLAEYFKVDATLIRLAWALAFFLGGTGFILYILAMIIMPENPGERYQPGPISTSVGPDEEKENPAEPPPFSPPPAAGANGSGDNKGRLILGLFLIAAGGYLLLKRFFPFVDLGRWWPLLLIILGVYIIARSK